MNGYHRSETSVTLSQPQAGCLLKLVERRVRNNDESEPLTEVQQRLSDAMWLAHWLRKQVTLDLRPEHVAALLDGFQEAPERESWSDDDRSVFKAIVDKLLLAAAAPMVSHEYLSAPDGAKMPLAHACEIHGPIFAE